MVWEIVIIRDLANIIVIIILLVTAFLTLKLMRKDKGTRWDYILIAICFLAISVCLDFIGHYLMMDMFNMLRRVGMLLSGIIFVGVFLSIKVQGGVIKKK